MFFFVILFFTYVLIYLLEALKQTFIALLDHPLR